MHSRRAFALRKSFKVGLLLPLAALFAGITKALGPQDEEVCAKIAALRKQLGTTVRWQNKQQTELSALRVEPRPGHAKLDGAAFTAMPLFLSPPNKRAKVVIAICIFLF